MISRNKKDIALACALLSTAIALPLASEAASAGTRIQVYASASGARNADVFRRIQPGMKAEQVVALIGSPDATMRFDAAHATAWDYEFRDTWGYDAEFSVMVGDDGVVRSTFTGRRDA